MTIPQSPEAVQPTIETNLLARGDLRSSAEALLNAAMDYHAEYRKATGGAAVVCVWVKDTQGRLVILTRGEYRDTLMRNVDALWREHEDEGVKEFDADEDAPSPEVREVLEKARVSLDRLLALPVAQKELAYLDKGIGTATVSAAWLHARAALAAIEALNNQPTERKEA